MGFLCSLVFLANLVSHLSVLNLQLQGKGHTVSHLVGHIEGFGGGELFGDAYKRRHDTFSIMPRIEGK
jgi:hypothetical protein